MQETWGIITHVGYSDASFMFGVLSAALVGTYELEQPIMQCNYVSGR